MTIGLLELMMVVPAMLVPLALLGVAAWLAIRIARSHRSLERRIEFLEAKLGERPLER